jgi:sialic acid synthase
LKMSKRITALRDLPAGHSLTMEDLAFKSPGDGLPPCDVDRVLGRCLVREVKQDEAILFNNLI